MADLDIKGLQRLGWLCVDPEMRASEAPRKSPRPQVPTTSLQEQFKIVTSPSWAGIPQDR